MASDFERSTSPESALAERLRLAQLATAVGIALTRAESLETTLSECARAMVDHLDAAFARIWTLDPAQ